MEWVKCSERLPEKSGSYLTCSRMGAMAVNYFSVRWQKWNVSDSNEDESWVNLMAIKSVVLWMPLPPLP